MGTSKGYVAPSSNDWGASKGEVTRLAKQSSINPTEIKEVLRNYIKLFGGPASAARNGGVSAGPAAQTTAARVAGFITAVGATGLADAYQKAGLGDLTGKTLDEVIHSILDYLGGPGSTFDEVDGRHAETLLMDEALENAVTVDEVEQILTDLASPNELMKLLTQFFGLYVYEQFKRVHYERLVQRAGAIKAEGCLDQIKDFIKAELKDKTFAIDISTVDWAGRQGQQIANEIFEKTLHVFGD